MDTVHVFAEVTRVGVEIPLVNKHQVAPIQNSNDASRTEVPQSGCDRRGEGHVGLHFRAVRCIQCSRHEEACPAYHYCRFTIQAQS